MNTILYLIDSGQFTSPLAGTNPHIIGNVGERRLVVRPKYFNPGPEMETLPAGEAVVEFGGIVTRFSAMEVFVNPGITYDPPAISLVLDVGGVNFPAAGEFTLRFTRGDRASAIIVRIDNTDLHLVSPWPTSSVLFGAAARDELVRLDLEHNLVLQQLMLARDEASALETKAVALESRLKQLTMLVNAT